MDFYISDERQIVLIERLWSIGRMCKEYCTTLAYKALRIRNKNQSTNA